MKKEIKYRKLPDYEEFSKKAKNLSRIKNMNSKNKIGKLLNNLFLLSLLAP